MKFLCFANELLGMIVRIFPSQLRTLLVQVAIVVVNVFYFVRIIRGTDASKGQSGYASFPEGSSSDQPYQGEEGDKQYAPPEY